MKKKLMGRYIVTDPRVCHGQPTFRGWRIPVRQIGHEVGRKGLQDEEIIPLLLTLHHPTLFTRDLGFHSRQLCHPNYSLVL